MTSRKVAEWFVHDARARPEGSLLVGIPQITAARVANSYLVKRIAGVHKNTADGFASASGGYGRGVGCVGGKIAGVPCKRGRTRQPYSYGLDVFWVVGAGKQGSKIERRIGWLVGGVDEFLSLFPSCQESRA